MDAPIEAGLVEDAEGSSAEKPERYKATRLRDPINGKAVQKIVGYDANSLYLHALAQVSIFKRFDNTYAGTGRVSLINHPGFIITLL